MSITRHPDFHLQRLSVGTEAAPLLVIDNAVANPDELVKAAATKGFMGVDTYYPGVRARTPLSFQRFVLEDLREEILRTFSPANTNLRFTACHYSLITTPPEKLGYLQRVPHIDSMNGEELALVMYLFKSDLGGTSFYRHRKTGFETVDHTRETEYLRHLEAEQDAVMRTSTGFIEGSNEFYERIGHQDGVFNRMLVYRRTTLHSGSPTIPGAISADPRRGRLCITGFLA